MTQFSQTVSKSFAVERTVDVRSQIFRAVLHECDGTVSHGLCQQYVATFYIVRDNKFLIRSESPREKYQFFHLAKTRRISQSFGENKLKVIERRTRTVSTWSLLLPIDIATEH